MQLHADIGRATLSACLEVKQIDEQLDETAQMDALREQVLPISCVVGYLRFGPIET
jgi:hypothetical protein